MDGTALLDAPARHQAGTPLPTDDSLHLLAVLEGLSAGLLSFSVTLQPLLVSTRFLSLLDIPAEAASATGVSELLQAARALTPEGLHDAERACAAVGAGDEMPLEPLRLAGTEARCFSFALLPLADGAWLATLEEVTARCAAEADARDQALRDPLTGLRNRQMFQDRVSAVLAQPVRGEAIDAVMMVDLDRFKAVNDTLGHPIGDGLLQLVAKRLRSLARSTDLPARLGGDEFALLARALPDRATAGMLAQRIVEVLGRPYLVEGHLVNIGASVGIALMPDDGTNTGSLLKNADLALYHAKGRGRSTWSFFDTEMDTRANARRSLEIDLRRALVLGEFELHYQPQVDLDTRQVVGFEALVRWRHPERGLIPPGDFITLAEEIGLIVPLGEWVLRTACQDANSWPHDLCVAVNVSPHQFEDATRLTDVVSHTLATSGLSGQRLEIEVTESVLLRNEATVLAALHRLRGMGVRVAMDDFGTGYSSLSQLHSFPFDKIKIDRSFIRDVGDVSSQNAIIRAITALGASLGMSTIAEGVETTDQLARIRSEGCSSVQGYLFSRPVPLNQIAEFLTNFETSRVQPLIPQPHIVEG